MYASAQVGQMAIVPHQTQQPSTDITNPDVFFKYCVPLQNKSRFTLSYPSLQEMIEKEKQEIIDRPKRAKRYFCCCSLILLGGTVGGIFIMLSQPDLEWLGIALLIVAGLSIIGLLANFRTAFVEGYVKHAGDIYYRKPINGIFFDINDTIIKRVKYKEDYGMTKQKETEPLEARHSYLHEPIVKILSTQMICTFSQLKNIGWQVKESTSSSTGPGQSAKTYTYYLVLQYNTNARNGDDYVKYKIDDYSSRFMVLRGYNRLKEVMNNVNPTWFSSGQCVDKGEKRGSWRSRR